LSFSINVLAQKPQNRIILWDVTQSMVGSTNNQAPDYGYNSNNDIDKQVREALIKIINDSKDDDGVFNIYPFGTDIWEYKSFSNNQTGRNEAVKYILNYKIGKKPTGYTNICAAWDKAMTHIDPKQQNVIFLFTDGTQNINYGAYGTNCLEAIVNKYCSLTSGTDTYTFYISLNVSDKTFQSKLSNACKNISVITAEDVKKIGVTLPLKLFPKFQPLTFNIQESLSTVERFRALSGNIPSKIGFLKADLELQGQYKIGVKANATSNKDGNLDINFSLEDISGKEIANLKSLGKLNITGKIIFSIEGSETTEIPINIINKKSPQLNFIIK
jgi:hypothetical protein